MADAARFQSPISTTKKLWVLKFRSFSQLSLKPSTMFINNTVFINTVLIAHLLSLKRSIYYNYSSSYPAHEVKRLAWQKMGVVVQKRRKKLHAVQRGYKFSELHNLAVWFTLTKNPAGMRFANLTKRTNFTINGQFYKFLNVKTNLIADWSTQTIWKLYRLCAIFFGRPRPFTAMPTYLLQYFTCWVTIM